MHIIRDDLVEIPSGLSSFSSMAPENKSLNIQHPSHFIAQGENLTALLSVVVHESESATNPDALIDYLELTSILTDLLEEARLFATFTVDQLQLRESHVRSFLDKIETVQHAVGDWNARTKVSMPASRKRARTTDLDEATVVALKRRRESDAEDHIPDGFCSFPIPSILPSIEESPTPMPWWNEPFCD